MESIELKIRDLCKKDKIAFKKHAFTRMLERSIASDDVVNAILNGKIIKKYKQDKPLSSYLILGYAANKKPLHILLAVDNSMEMLWIITAYKPDRNLWSSDFKRRKI